MATIKKENRIEAVPWGVPALDELTKGLTKNALNIIETPNYHSGIVALGQFLFEGLKRGEKVALVTFDPPTVFLENFLNWNLDFRKHLEDESFFFLNYNPDVSNEIALTHDYSALFGELKRLCKGQAPARVGFYQIDALVSLSNVTLMNSCAQKIALASSEIHGNQSTILGQFVQFGDEVHKNLSIALQKTSPGYFCLENRGPAEAAADRYSFLIKKLPWFSYSHLPAEICLKEGQGFVGGQNHGAVESRSAAS